MADKPKQYYVWMYPSGKLCEQCVDGRVEAKFSTIKEIIKRHASTPRINRGMIVLIKEDLGARFDRWLRGPISQLDPQSRPLRPGDLRWPQGCENCGRQGAYDQHQIWGRDGLRGYGCKRKVPPIEPGYHWAFIRGFVDPLIAEYRDSLWYITGFESPVICDKVLSQVIRYRA